MGVCYYCTTVTYMFCGGVSGVGGVGGVAWEGGVSV